MTQPSTLPLSASRFLASAGFWISGAMAILCLLVTIALAAAGPLAQTAAIDKALDMKLADMQPWIALVMLGATAVLALAARMFDRLSMILTSVSEGDPFTVDNSRRLRHIGWLMIFMQIIGFFTGLAGNQLPAGQNYGNGFEFSVSGLLAAFLAFVVAQLFEQARAMRDELEGTI
jgi:Protein of unknown function (DUF2975)